jgi:hypothetical protein
MQQPRAQPQGKVASVPASVSAGRAVPSRRGAPFPGRPPGVEKKNHPALQLLRTHALGSRRRDRKARRKVGLGLASSSVAGASPSADPAGGDGCGKSAAALQRTPSPGSPEGGQHRRTDHPVRNRGRAPSPRAPEATGASHSMLGSHETGGAVWDPGLALVLGDPARTNAMPAPLAG